MAGVYRTLNRVFRKKSARQPACSIPVPGATAEAASLPKDGGDAERPASPLPLGSPSVSEATVKKVVPRIFPPAEGLQGLEIDAGALGKVTSGAGAAGRGTTGAEGAGTGASRPAGARADVATEMLAFEVASIMRRMLEISDSMTDKTLAALRSNLQAPGVVTLISSDVRVLWALAGHEKQQELAVVASRVAVLGRKCRDQRLRKLRVLFDELDNPSASFQEFSATLEEADVLITFMREQADATAKLKAEMESIQLLHTRIQEYGEWNSLQGMVTQGKLVEKLQGHCLWSYNFDYLVQVLVVATCSLRKRIFASFGNCTCPDVIKAASLGEAGLALHYANIVVLLERIIQQPDAVLGPTRDELYGMLPRSIQLLLRQQLHNHHNFAGDGRVEANLKRGLLLLPTMAHNTILWHSLHTPGATQDSSDDAVFQVQTFYYANRDAVNAALVDVLLGLCRICGVEKPIAGATKQSSAPQDQKQVLAKLMEEEQETFSRLLKIEERENKFGGEVTRTVDVREDKTKKEATGKEASGGEQPLVSENLLRQKNGEAEAKQATKGGDGQGLLRTQSVAVQLECSLLSTLDFPTEAAAAKGALESLPASPGQGQAGPSHLRKKSHSQIFFRGGGFSEMAHSSSDRGSREGQSEAGEGGRARRSQSRHEGEAPMLLRRALPPCFGPTQDYDSDSDSEHGPERDRTSTIQRGVRTLSRRFARNEGTSSTDGFGLRRTKHYHSQPVNLGRPKSEYA